MVVVVVERHWRRPSLVKPVVKSEQLLGLLAVASRPTGRQVGRPGGTPTREYGGQPAFVVIIAAIINIQTATLPYPRLGLNSMARRPRQPAVDEGRAKRGTAGGRTARDMNNKSKHSKTQHKPTKFFEPPTLPPLSSLPLALFAAVRSRPVRVTLNVRAIKQA